MIRGVWGRLMVGVGLALLSVGVVHGRAAAQECARDVLLALARAGAACRGQERGAWCAANGDVRVQQDGTPEVAPATVGTRAPLALLRAISVVGVPGDGQPLALAQLLLDADLPDAQRGGVTLLMFGDATLTNDVPFMPTVRVEATTRVPVRSAPSATAPILRALALREAVPASGVSADGAWVRVRLPDARVGWASASLLSAPGGLAALNTVTPGDAARTPFQALTVARAASTPSCGTGVRGGVLLQTPANTFVTLTVNGATVRAQATLLLMQDDVMRIVTLSGVAEVLSGNERVVVPAGAMTAFEEGVPRAAVPIPPELTAQWADLPLNNLPTRVRTPLPLSEQALAASIARYDNPPVAPTPVPTATPDASACRRILRRTADVRSGPGGRYEVTGGLAAGGTLSPVQQATDATGATWFLLNTGGWVAAADVLTTGTCPDVPFSTFVQAPTSNTYVMERCESTNGPLRAGQTVTIVFTPQAFIGLNDANAAPRIDPGRIEVGSARLRPAAGTPTYVFTDEEGRLRYTRTFSVTWRARQGTVRLYAARLDYQRVCNATVLAN